MRGQKRRREATLFPRRGARSASAPARSRNSGQFGGAYRFRRSDHPVRFFKGGFATIQINVAAPPPLRGGALHKKSPNRPPRSLRSRLPLCEGENKAARREARRQGVSSGDFLCKAARRR